MISGVHDWSGAYLGINGGYGSSSKCWSVVAVGTTRVPPVADGCHDATGGTGGGQFGYRWQSGGLVFGLEAQANLASLQGSNTSLITGVSANRSRLNAVGLLTGQIGYAWSSALVYLKGGAAATGERYDVLSLANGAVLASSLETRSGGTAGVGLEFGFASNWSAAVEYDRLFMGSRDNTFKFSAPPTITGRISQDADIVTARINYRWEWPLIKY